MITINVTANAQPAIDLLTNVQRRHVPFAMARALSMTASRIKDAEQREMRDVFDRPTPYTLNAVYLINATKQNLRAVVGIKDNTFSGRPQIRYLRTEVFGGARGEKPYEKALRSVGVLPEGYVTVPGQGAKIDAYGNMDRGQIKQILSFFQAAQGSGSSQNMTSTTKRRLAKTTKKKLGMSYFVGRPGDGKLPWGIWARYDLIGRAIKPMLLFVTRAQYEAIFDFYYVGRKVVEDQFVPQFNASMKEALAGSAS